MKKRIIALTIALLLFVSMLPMTTIASNEITGSESNPYRNDVTHLRGQNNTTHNFYIVGATGTTIWGTYVYTDDSPIRVAAVHAGIVAIGEGKVVTIRILPGYDSYNGTTRNGVTSSSYNSWGGSYEFVKNSTPPAETTTPPPPPSETTTPPPAETTTPPPTETTTPPPSPTTETNPASSGASTWAVEQVSQALNLGLVPSSLRSNYQQAATRAEFATLAVTLYELERGAITGTLPSFSDTSDLNIRKAAFIGVVLGVGDNRFNPYGSLTREQAATMLARLSDTMGQPFPYRAPTFDDNGDIATWARDAVGRAQAAEVMQGVGGNRFSPRGSYTREQCIATILRTFEAVGGIVPQEPETELLTGPEALFWLTNGNWLNDWRGAGARPYIEITDDNYRMTAIVNGTPRVLSGTYVFDGETALFEVDQDRYNAAGGETEFTMTLKPEANTIIYQETFNIGTTRSGDEFDLVLYLVGYDENPEFPTLDLDPTDRHSSPTVPVGGDEGPGGMEMPDIEMSGSASDIIMLIDDFSLKPPGQNGPTDPEKTKTPPDTEKPRTTGDKEKKNIEEILKLGDNYTFTGTRTQMGTKPHNHSLLLRRVASQYGTSFFDSEQIRAEKLAFGAAQYYNGAFGGLQSPVSLRYSRTGEVESWNISAARVGPLRTVSTTLSDGDSFSANLFYRAWDFTFRNAPGDSTTRLIYYPEKAMVKGVWSEANAQAGSQGQWSAFSEITLFLSITEEGKLRAEGNLMSVDTYALHTVGYVEFESDSSFLHLIFQNPVESEGNENE